MASKKTVSAANSSLFLSPAKINLFLHITAKRTDGYHDINSLMQPVSLYDTVEIEVTDKGDIEVCANEPGVPDGSGNIAFRAAELFFEETGQRRGVKVSIKKRIPHGAGLGGGSSNAATVLMGLNQLLDSGLSTQRLIAIGSRLGSDVPFFMLKSAAIATGRGTELRPVKLSSYRYVLIKPDFNVSTVWAYTNFNLTKRVEDNNLIYSEATLNDIRCLTRFMINDLESVTAAKHPQIGKIKEALISAGAEGALMSGSGSTVFGLFSDKVLAENAALLLKSSLSSTYGIFHVRGL